MENIQVLLLNVSKSICMIMYYVSNDELEIDCFVGNGHDTVISKLS